MPVIHNGNRTYKIKRDGKFEYAYTTSFEIDGKKLYDFDPKTGVLRISMSPSDLEVLLEKIGEIPAGGKDFTLPAPISPVSFRSVKRIEPIQEQENEYLLKITSKENKQV